MEYLFGSGIALIVFGIVLGLFATSEWGKQGFGDIKETTTIRVVIVSSLLLTLGGITTLAGGCAGLMGLLLDNVKHPVSTPAKEL